MGCRGSLADLDNGPDQPRREAPVDLDLP